MSKIRLEITETQRCKVSEMRMHDAGILEGTDPPEIIICGYCGDSKESDQREWILLQADSAISLVSPELVRDAWYIPIKELAIRVVR